MKVLSQIARQGDPRFLQAAQGDYWFWRRGYQVVQFEPRALEAGFFDEDLNDNAEHTIVFGALGVIHQALGRVNRPVPPRLEFPSELTQFVGPAVRECTMGDLRTWERTGLRWRVRLPRR